MDNIEYCRVELTRKDSDKFTVSLYNNSVSNEQIIETLQTLIQQISSQEIQSDKVCLQ